VYVKVLVGKAEGKRPPGRPRCRWVENIRTDLQEVGCGYMDWIGLAQDRDRWRTLVSVVMNLRVRWNAGNFLTSCKPVSFSRRTLQVRQVTVFVARPAHYTVLSPGALSAGAQWRDIIPAALRFPVPLAPCIFGPRLSAIPCDRDTAATKESIPLPEIGVTKFLGANRKCVERNSQNMAAERILLVSSLCFCAETVNSWVVPEKH